MLQGCTCVWVLGDCYFLIIHLLDSLSLRGLHSKTIPICWFWWKQNVERESASIPLTGGRYDLVAALLNSEEIASRNQLQSAATEGTSVAAASSSAPPPAASSFSEIYVCYMWILFWQVEYLYAHMCGYHCGKLKVLGAGIDRHLG
ncbi:unnamed protein product [Linum trigynum]|uniref:Uncharacterized protein n=1 Tax=Linum trigynum TaxID=586398 RepID=A0AAV2F970_9ROSI